MCNCLILLTALALPANAPDSFADDEIQSVPLLQESEAGRQTSKRDSRKEQSDKPPGRNRKARSYSPPANAWEVASIILGRPARHSISVSVVPATDLEGFVEYRVAGDSSSTHSASLKLPARTGTVFELQDLQADARYVYRLAYRDSEHADFSFGPEYSYHTQRTPGSTFSFQLQGDSHPERNPKQHLPEMYEQTLLAVAADAPDFYLTMGDDFSVDTLKTVTRDAVEQVYLRHLPYLGLVGHSSPLFLVNGNHEQAAKYVLDGTPDNMAVWAQNSRNTLFPQPAPDGFYSGNPQPVEHIGLLRNYFAWTWGDGLFVVIDPYWHSDVAVDNRHDGANKSREHWKKTLGEAQYLWLKQTLEQSDANFKFVFAHHVNGSGRGGVRQAGLYEWGGNNPKGRWEFDQQRPEWEMPIHELMAENGVAIFFQGHDHVYAVEEKDGVIYQTMPEPADPNYALYFREAFTGTVLPNSGRVRVTVSPAQVDVEYVLTVLPGDENAQRRNNAVAHRYSVVSGSEKEGERQ